jgi:hypothetical protein
VALEDEVLAERLEVLERDLIERFLRELEERVGLGDLPKAQRHELVLSAISACGFTDPVEAHCAVGVLLQGIETPDLL